MSIYTTMMLACGPMDACAKVGELNAALEAMELSVFSGEAEDCVFAMTDRNLPELWVIDVINAIQWHNPQAIQVWMRSEHDLLFEPMKIHPFAMPGYVMVEQGGEWSMERHPEPLLPLTKAAEKAFGTANRLTVRAVAAMRLGKLEEFVVDLREDELASLGIGHE